MPRGDVDTSCAGSSIAGAGTEPGATARGRASVRASRARDAGLGAGEAQSRAVNARNAVHGVAADLAPSRYGPITPVVAGEPVYQARNQEPDPVPARVATRNPIDRTVRLRGLAAEHTTAVHE